MIIYEVTNKYKTMINRDTIFETLVFSKYYSTKEEALDNTANNLECYKLELNSLGREDIAYILSMNHVRMEHIQGGWNEVHDISHITKSEELINGN